MSAWKWPVGWSTFGDGAVAWRKANGTEHGVTVMATRGRWFKKRRFVTIGHLVYAGDLLVVHVEGVAVSAAGAALVEPTPPTPQPSGPRSRCLLG